MFQTLFVQDISAPGPVKFLDEIPILKVLAKEAKAAGAKIVIALGHSGFEMDKAIAEQVPEVDVVVGGHTDTFLYTGNLRKVYSIQTLLKKYFFWCTFIVFNVLSYTPNVVIKLNKYILVKN